MSLTPSKLGSLEDWLVAICAEAARRGHRVTLVTHEPVHEVVAHRVRALGADWRAFASVAAAPLREGRRLAREADVVLLNLVQPRERMALAAYAAWPRPVLFIDGDSTPRATPRSTRWTALRALADRVTAPHIGGVAGVSEFVTARTARRFGLEAARARTIYNGVDEARFQPAEPRLPDGILRLITVAHLIPDKGVDVLLDALARVELPHVRLTIVGEGPQRAAYEALAATLGVADRVTFLGSRNDVEALLAAHDVLVHPCTWKEAFGLVIAEAMACGRPVIASRTGGIPEIVEDGVSGWLVPPGDAGALADALRRAAADPAASRRMGFEGRRVVERRFRLTDCAAAHLDWCEEVAARTAR